MDVGTLFTYSSMHSISRMKRDMCKVVFISHEEVLDCIDFKAFSLAITVDYSCHQM